MNAHPDTDVSGDLARDGELGTPNFQTLKDAEKAFSMLRAQMRQVVAHFQNPERAKDSTPAETEAETEAEAEAEAEAEVEDEDDDDALVHSLTEISMKPEAKILTADFKISMGHAAAGNLPEHGRMSCGRTVKYHDHHAKQTAFFFFVYS